jgi:hypothetical protein
MQFQCDTADWNSSLHRGQHCSGQVNTCQTKAATPELLAGVAAVNCVKRESTSIAVERLVQALRMEQESLS